MGRMRWVRFLRLWSRYRRLMIVLLRLEAYLIRLRGIRGRGRWWCGTAYRPHKWNLTWNQRCLSRLWIGIRGWEQKRTVNLLKALWKAREELMSQVASQKAAPMILGQCTYLSRHRINRGRVSSWMLSFRSYRVMQSFRTRKFFLTQPKSYRSRRWTKRDSGNKVR